MNTYRMKSDKGDGVKPMKCLKCDHIFRTTPERRLCRKCLKNIEDMEFLNLSNQKQTTRYGDMGIWEKNVREVIGKGDGK